jgi:ferredoxin
MGNNQQTLLEQVESSGKSITNSCRAGLCGACKVQLESGQVDHPDVPALSAEERAMGKVLACCAIPQTDVTLTDLTPKKKTLTNKHAANLAAFSLFTSEQIQKEIAQE